MKNYTAVLILSMSLLASSVFAGGRDTGGQGALKVNGYNLTLAEAGFRIREESKKDPILTAPVINEIRRIINSIPVVWMREMLTNETIRLDQSKYIQTDSYNKELLKKIKKDYAKIMQENNFHFKNKDFLILAVSSEGENTYLLPKYFAQNTSDTTRAMAIIHEAVVRNIGSFEQALRLDGALLDGQYLIAAIVLNDMSRPNLAAYDGFSSTRLQMKTWRSKSAARFFQTFAAASYAKGGQYPVLDDSLISLLKSRSQFDVETAADINGKNPEFYQLIKTIVREDKDSEDDRAVRMGIAIQSLYYSSELYNEEETNGKTYNEKHSQFCLGQKDAYLLTDIIKTELDSYSLIVKCENESVKEDIELSLF